jgi:hypothetical protein
MGVRFERLTRQRRVVVSATVATALAAVAASVALGAPRPPVLKAGNPGGIVFAHGAHGSKPRGGSSPDLVNHGGIVLSGGTTVTPIFWGTSWGTNAGDKISGLGTFYSGIGGSRYLGTTTEYSGSNGGVSNVITAQGPLYVSTQASKGAPSTSTVLQVVTAALKGATPVKYGYYPVYSDQPRGGANYCAWHTWGSIDGAPIEFAFFFNLDNDPGCDVSTTYGHSAGLAALGNVSGHELSESLTDPQLNAWYDKSGAENADKCAWTFSGKPVAFGSVSWQIQGNWSNNSYDTHNPTSYLGTGSGCVDGNQ